MGTAELFVSSECSFCKKILEEMKVLLGEKFERAVVVKDVDKENQFQIELLKMNFLSTPVLKVDERTWAVNQINKETIKQVCASLSSKF